MPDFPISLFSGIKLYLAGGWFQGTTVFSAPGQEIAQLSIKTDRIKLVISYQPLTFPVVIYTAKPTIELWHWRLGYLGFDNVQNIAKITTSMLFEKRASDINLGVTKLYKPYKLVKPKYSVNRQLQLCPLKILEEVYANMIQVIPIRYNRYTQAIILTNSATYICQGQSFINKEDAYSSLIIFLKLYKTQFRIIPKKICLDSGPEFSGQKFRNIYQKLGILLEITTPYTYKQIGISEHVNHIITKYIRSIIIDTNIPRFLQPKIFLAVIYVINRVATSIIENMTLYKAFIT